MKKRLLFAPIIAIAMLSSCAGEAEKSNTEADHEISNESSEKANAEDSQQSGKIHWKGSMQGMYDHDGTIAFKDVDFKIEDGTLVSGNFTVDMTTIEPTDANYTVAEGKTREKLVGHLSSEGFFDVATFPTATFEVIPNTESKTVTGNLTIKGITNEVTLNDIRVSEDGKSMKAIFVIDRTAFGVSFEHPLKEMIISNDIEFRVAITDN